MFTFSAFLGQQTPHPHPPASNQRGVNSKLPRSRLEFEKNVKSTTTIYGIFEKIDKQISSTENQNSMRNFIRNHLRKISELEHI